MQQEVGWIIEALERSPSKTRTGLAAVLNIDKSGVSRLLRGGRRLKFEEAQRVADYLGVSQPLVPPTGFAEADDEFAHASAQDQSGKNRSSSPMHACRVNGGGFWRLDRGEVIERRERAPQFYGAALVFGFYAPDDAMAPRIYAGETIWANPARMAAVGQDALILPADENAAECPVFMCRLDAKTADHISGFQYGAGEERCFDLSKWRAVHVFGRD
ncbi:helix-turn-helix domain-containing protein [Hyphococcus sp.]|uniref:helix-turn-helix domain-containing protein n=1 Tax=Hyphococcus sp. TaxID=2038636 RepID=UPI003752AFB6